MFTNKEPTLNWLFEELESLADKDYQRRVWIGGEGPDFDEAVIRFSEVIDSIFEKAEKIGVSDSQLQILKKFYNEFQKFSDDNDLPQLFIDTPEWTRITLMAKEVLKAFNYRSPHV